MEQHFIVAVKAIIPLFILIGMGIYVRWRKMLTDTELQHVNAMVFRVFFFCMMFYNMYTTTIATAFRPRLMAFTVTALFVMLLVSGIVVCTVEKDNRSRGAMLQGLFRSNFVLLGLPLVENIFGPEAVAVPTMMIAVVSPIYNIVSIFILESFRGKGRFSLASSFAKVLQNPMIVGALLGLFFVITGISVPEPLLKPVRQIAYCTSPVALLILGASFRFGTVSEEKRNLAILVLGRLLVIPALVMGTAYYMGFRGVDFVTILCIFATPCAVASFAMAQQLGSNAELAGNGVVVTSAFSSITLFFWVVLFKALGVF
ncbi:MAG: AEC family transporter [Acidaminococcaceae bacterium]|nr:AEC family transporter [Acidaminococcaceae bacterium]MBQ5345878.1 AEC family transporter [Acidaminococcaceae bacterium]MBQ8492014.1 AEC family transporter [Acidaminococcaceae bacterium]MBQ9283440.1 AEC family transporter [Acidaminococcaceae bacterium]MBQ9320713.1 AEC family transporter [Acidaminococcaceae bacterium]